MLKKRELQDSQILFDLMIHRDVFPFVRQKANSYEEFLFLTKQTIEAEDRGELISRTILDEWGTPIGTINLFNIENGAGFLGTWLGKPYHGKGYNQLAKEVFFDEVFHLLGIEKIFMRIRKENIRSYKAAEKLPYVIMANDSQKDLLSQLNAGEYQYNLFEIPKDLYMFHVMRQETEFSENHLLEA